MRPWKAAYDSSKARIVDCFNGATTLRPWKGVRPLVYRRDGPASMGPRPCGRGRSDMLAMGGQRIVLQWGHDLAAVEGVSGAPKSKRCPGFNGATTLRPWKVRPGTGTNPSTPGSFNGATTLRPWKGTPLPPGRPSQPSFNGATTLRPWKGGSQSRRPLWPLASMGPRPCGRGRAAGRARGPRRRRLQWGHDLAAVEGRRKGSRGHGSSLASMGPRPCGRGRRCDMRSNRRCCPASMGPRPCGRGRARVVRTAFAAECFNGATTLRPWKGGAAAKPHARAALSFNGATTLRPWKVISRSMAASSKSRFNGATTLRPWKGRGRGQRPHAKQASMGPRPCGRGRCGDPLRRCGRRVGFNGATTLRPWKADGHCSYAVAA